MNCIIPFEKKVKFDYPVKEICSISLEHEITKNDTDILGNFLVSGTLKKHELSINTVDFDFTIPFALELTNPIYNDTLEFMIDNFTYEIDDDEMLVKIDYAISADDREEEEEIREDSIGDGEVEPADLIEDIPCENEEIKKEISDNCDDTKSAEVSEDASCEEDRAEIDINMIGGLNMSDDYQTFYVHFVKKEETLDTICSLYKADKEEIIKLNEISEVMENDKILIPKADE